MLSAEMGVQQQWKVFWHFAGGQSQHPEQACSSRRWKFPLQIDPRETGLVSGGVRDGTRSRGIEAGSMLCGVNIQGNAATRDHTGHDWWQAWFGG